MERGLDVVIGAAMIVVLLGTIGTTGQAGEMAVAPAAAAADTAHPLSDPARQALVTMLDEERRTAAEYERVLRDHGRVAPFAELARAERSHVEFIAYALRRRGLPIPPDRFTPNGAPAYRTVREACAAAARAAARNAAMYDRYLELDIPDDVKHAFRHNRNVSKHEHLPKLQQCAGGAGGNEPTIIS